MLKRWEKVEGRVGEGTLNIFILAQKVLVSGWFYVPGCSISFSALS